jgi:hypothetical protein
MKLEINVPVSGLDLASLLESEQGVFLCQNRGQKLHHRREVRSLDRLRADAHRKGDPGAGSNDARARAMVRHENQPLN